MTVVKFVFRLILFCSLCLSHADSDAQDAAAIVKKADERVRGNTSIATLTIQIVRPSWKRDMSLKAWTKGTDYSLILITAPAKDKGVVFLKRKKEVWNWIPAIERNIKLPPSMMSQSWMGTDFTNDDLVKEASISSDYTHKIIGKEIIDGRSCFKIEMIPKAQAAVVWGKIITWIDENDFIIMKAEYYDEDGLIVNSMFAGDIRLLGGRLLPARMEMIPADKKGHKTVMIYHSLTFDQPINENFFSSENMSKVR